MFNYIYRFLLGIEQATGSIQRTETQSIYSPTRTFNFITAHSVTSIVCIRRSSRSSFYARKINAFLSMMESLSLATVNSVCSCYHFVQGSEFNTVFTAARGRYLCWPNMIRMQLHAKTNMLTREPFRCDRLRLVRAALRRPAVLFVQSFFFIDRRFAVCLGKFCGDAKLTTLSRLCGFDLLFSDSFTLATTRAPYESACGPINTKLNVFPKKKLCSQQSTICEYNHLLLFL